MEETKVFHAFSNFIYSLSPKIRGRMKLIREIKKFGKQLNLLPTKNFFRYENGVKSYSSWLATPKNYLPYSYEDFSLQHFHSEERSEVEKLDENFDVYFNTYIAVGRIGGSPLTRGLAAQPSTPDFISIIFHEDFHDQYFNLNAGIDESFATLFGLEAAKKFTKEKYGENSREYLGAELLAIHYEIRFEKIVKLYEELENLYSLPKNGRLTKEAVNKKKEGLFEEAEHDRNAMYRNMFREFPEMLRNLNQRKVINNASIAHAMTYARHYSTAKNMFEALGNDLTKLIIFLQEASPEIPAIKNFAKDDLPRYTKPNLAAYENAVIEKLWKLLAKYKK